MIIAIDPGSEESAVVWWDGRKVINAIYQPNEAVVCRLEQLRDFEVPLAIEMIGHYGTGMPAGKTVFDTCVWIGRFMQAYGPDKTTTVLRPTVKAHICGNARAKDGNVRQALIDLLGPPGTKKAMGPTYGISGDMWQALAVAVCAWDLSHVNDTR